MGHSILSYARRCLVLNRHHERSIPHLANAMGQNTSFRIVSSDRRLAVQFLPLLVLTDISFSPTNGPLWSTS